MRSCALFALASVTALALTLPCAAEEPARTSSVAKETAPQLQVPSLLAPPQAATVSPLPTRASPVPSDAPASSVQAAARPTEVKTETYMRPPVPAVPAPSVSVAPQTAAPSPPPDMTGDAQASRERDGGFTSPDQLMDWISNYRDHREPWRVPAAVHAMNDFGLFGDEEKAWFCIGFIAGVLGSNPKDGPSLVPKMFPMPDKEQAIIIRAIVYSGRPDWRELLEKNSSRMPLRRPLIDDFLNDKRPTLMTLPLDTGGSPGIYALWGYYVATGQHEPVVRIMEALRWSKTKADSGFSFRKVFSGWGRDPSALDKITTGGTAKWTLASYAERDRQLLALYRAEFWAPAGGDRCTAQGRDQGRRGFRVGEGPKGPVRRHRRCATAEAQQRSGNDQGRDRGIDRDCHRLRRGLGSRASLYRASLRDRRRALYWRRQARPLIAVARYDVILGGWDRLLDRQRPAACPRSQSPA